MKIVNANPEILTPGWLATKLPGKIPPGIEGLSGVFFVKASFRLHPDAPPTPLPDGPLAASGEAPMRGDKKLGPGYPSDFVPYKPVADFSLVGTAYAPEGIPAPSFPCKLKVGTVEKELLVMGKRTWDNHVLSSTPAEPDPVLSIPLAYAYAFGGKHDPANPFGRGRSESDLPNLELPGEPILHPTSNVPPATFAPLAYDWPFRSSKLGTCGPNWRKTGWPWLPADFDYSYFNAAPASQWLPGYLAGNEALTMHNMHPKHPHYHTALPGLRSRCFVNRLEQWEAGPKKENRQLRFTEVPLVLDTLWIDMDQEILVLVWRGRTPISSVKFLDIEHVFVCAEPLDTPSRPASEYQAALHTHLSPPPEPLPGNDPGPPNLPSDASAPVRVDLDQIRTQGASHRNFTGADFSGADLSGLTFQGSVLARCNFTNTSLIGTNLSGTDLGNADLTGANLSSASLVGADLTGAVTVGTIWRHSKLGGAVLSRLDLQGADFTHCVGEHVDFAGAQLRGANFTGANLPNALFTGATVEKATFEKAKLRFADFRGAKATGVRMTGADAAHLRCGEGAVFDEANLAGLVAPGSVWENASLKRANFARGSLPGARFCEAILDDAQFRGADLTQCSFEDARMHGCDVSNSNLLRATFDRADLTKATLNGANLYDCGFWDTILEHAHWEGADISDTTLEI